MLKIRHGGTCPYSQQSEGQGRRIARSFRSPLIPEQKTVMCKSKLLEIDIQSKTIAFHL